ncbi:MAG TPA: hypothetical protein VN437_07710, partial [Rectinemataceae bacterium]|nr:hypothetical protein [Rectinemataceae bacterium]
ENGEAREGSVIETMAALLWHDIGENENLAWLAGHRPVAGNYVSRARGRLIQFHNPARRNIAWIDNRAFAGSAAIAFYEIKPRGKKPELLETLPPIHLDQTGRGH